MTAAVSIVAASVAACDRGDVFAVEVKVHACSVLTTDDATAILGGPVTPAARAYRVEPEATELHACYFELVADDESVLTVNISTATMEEADYWDDSGGRRLGGLGRDAIWWPDPGRAILEVLTEEGVLLSWFVTIPGADPEELFARTEPVVRRVVPRVKDALPGTDRADGIPPAPADLCALAGREAASSGVLASGRTYRRTYVGGRYGGGWQCTLSSPRGDGQHADTIEVRLSMKAPTKEELAATQGRSIPVPQVGQYAYWESREETVHGESGTLSVLTHRGNHLEIRVGLPEAAQEQPTAIRVAEHAMASL